MTREQKDRWRNAPPPIPPDVNPGSSNSEPGGVAIDGESIDGESIDGESNDGESLDGESNSELASFACDHAAEKVAESELHYQISNEDQLSVKRVDQATVRRSSQLVATGSASSGSASSGSASSGSASSGSASSGSVHSQAPGACPPIAASVSPEETNVSFFSRLMLANSWIVSLVLHLVIFLLLSLVTYSIHEGASLEIELAQMGDDQPALTLESFDSDESTDGSDLDAEMEQLLAANEQSAELDFSSESLEFEPNVSLNNEVGFDEMSADAAAVLASDANRRLGDGNDAEFFGIQANGKDFVFIVDSSGSMSGRRWRNAVRELGDSLAALQENQRFYVIFFDVETHLMFQGQVQAFRKTKKLQMLNANKSNLAKAKRWFARIKLGQRTQPRVSFDYGLSLKPDAIFFLTDGEFDDGTYEFLMGVAAQSGDFPTIHTVAFGNPLAAPTLEEIASRFKGKYQFVR